MPQQQWAPPPPPTEPQQEGARWRFHRPSSEAVAEWFGTQPLDEGMEHAHYVGGVVLIPQNEKVRYTKPDGGLMDRYEQVFTPYVQIGTRVSYMRRLAEHRGLIYHPEPAPVPRGKDSKSLYFNANMPDGFWWHVVMSEGGSAVRYLCATYRVALYEPTSFAAKMRGESPMPVLLGEGTKQVSGGPDPNGLMKASTGAIGRALGVAGILTVGTGIATAEDLQEYQGPPMQAPPDAAQLPATPELPESAGAPPTPQSEEEALAQLRAQAMAFQTRLQEQAPDSWREFVAWWQERKQEAGWGDLGDVPFGPLKGIVSRMERLLAEASTKPAPPVPTT